MILVLPIKFSFSVRERQFVIAIASNTYVEVIQEIEQIITKIIIPRKKPPSYNENGSL